jgi:hypothetical protein
MPPLHPRTDLSRSGTAPAPPPPGMIFPLGLRCLLLISNVALSQKPVAPRHAMGAIPSNRITSHFSTLDTKSTDTIPSLEQAATIEP